MSNFKVVSKFLGYVTKPDATNTDGRYLVSGSKNVLVNDAEKVATREGYTRDGAADSTIAPIDSSFEWLTNSASELALRAGNALLQVRINGAWETLKDTLTSTNLVFTTWWDNARKFDILVWVDGTATQWYWTGAVATLSAITDATHITANEQIGAARFSSAGVIRIKDSGGVWRQATYTSAATNVFTVTTDLTAFTFDANAIVMEEPKSNATTPAANFLADFVFTSNNHLVVGSTGSRLVYVSQNDSISDFTFSSPRVAGEGELLTLDNYAVGGADINGTIFLTAGKDDWYKVVFEQITVGSTLTETSSVKKLKTASGQAALSHDHITTVGDSIAFVSNEPALRLLGPQQNYPDVQMKSLSNPIKPDFDAADFTGGNTKSHKNRIYVTAPTDGTLFINEISEDENGHERRFWQPPQTLPVQRTAVIGGELYGHSNAVQETYKLFDGTSDNGNNIEAVAKFAYQTFGEREAYKVFSKYFSEGYIASNTSLTLRLNYDYGGATLQVDKTVVGTDSALLALPQASNALGDNPMGDVPIGTETESIDFPKFRVIHSVANKDFFELQAIYSSNDVDQRWQILAHGPNAIISKNSPSVIDR